jgi:uracil-DNA glycosylase family 4
LSVTAEEFRKTILECKRCRLGESRKIAVPGAGCENARIMLVGEGPGKTEDETGQPFVGRAGELLDLMLDAVGLSRNTNVFITNIVKCRPPGNREPLPDEMDACLPYLRRQVLDLKPAFIVCLGRVAACRLIDPDFKVTRQHGQFFHKNGLIFMGTLHPAALLRNPSLKPQAFSDWVALRNQIRQTCPEILDEVDFV